MLPKIAPLILFASSCSAYAEPGQTEWVATPNRAYAAMPPTSLTDGKVGDVSWSPDGAHLLVAERPITTSREQTLRFDGSTPTYGSLELLGWDRRFHQIRHLWSTEDTSATIDNVAWFKGTSVALITVRWVVRDGPQAAQHPLYGVLNMDVATGKYRWVPGMEQLVARPSIYSSPTQPIAAATYSDNPEVEDNSSIVREFEELAKALIQVEVKLNVADSGGDGKAISVGNGNVFMVVSQGPLANNFLTIDAGGSIVHAIKVQKPMRLQLVWNTDGNAWFLVNPDPQTKKSGLAHLTDDGNLVQTTEQEFVAKKVVSDLAVTPASATAKRGKAEVNYTNIWLHSQTAVEHGEMLLCADGEWPELSPTCGGVFYIEGGVAKVREFIPLTADQRRMANEAAELAELANFAGTVVHFTIVPDHTEPTQP